MGMTYAEASRRISSRELALWRVAERLTAFAAMEEGLRESRHQVQLAPLLGGETVTLKPGEYQRVRRRRKQKGQGGPSVLMKAAGALGLKVVPRVAE
jgi:hypothetical protein